MRRIRADLTMQDDAIVEINSVEVVAAIQKKQLLPYLRLAGKGVGLLINWVAKKPAKKPREPITRDRSAAEGR